MTTPPFQTADLSDEHPKEFDCASPIFRSFGKKTAFWGQITTVKLFEDYCLWMY